MHFHSFSNDVSRDRAKEFHQWVESRRAANRDSLINILSSSTSSLSSSELIKDYETRDCQLKGRKVRFKKKRRDREIDCTFRRPQLRGKKSDKFCDFCIFPKNIMCLTVFITCLVIMFVLTNFYSRLERFNQVLKILDHQQHILNNHFAELRSQIDLQSKQISSLSSQPNHPHKVGISNERQLDLELLSNDSNKSSNSVNTIVQKLSIKVQAIINQLNNRVNAMESRMKSLEQKLTSPNNHFSDESIALLAKRLIDTQVDQVEIKAKLNATINMVGKLQKAIVNYKTNKSTSKAINHHSFNESLTSESDIVTGHLSL